ncbi:hypothetical protein NDU88_001272 [Pleurodeles waltl]|uniref:Uncharacterized protein n=1 Tax=Pleurodeles waltl TaxID=8319 RepID=A0AAV7V9B0_PLEWA|nr:hypothetical protein NDU88_001272 [Pleurodeles waltl]
MSYIDSASSCTPNSTLAPLTRGHQWTAIFPAGKLLLTGVHIEAAIPTSLTASSIQAVPPKGTAASSGLESPPPPCLDLWAGQCCITAVSPSPITSASGISPAFFPICPAGYPRRRQPARSLAFQRAPTETAAGPVTVPAPPDRSPRFWPQRSTATTWPFLLVLPGWPCPRGPVIADEVSAHSQLTHRAGVSAVCAQCEGALRSPQSTA